MVNGNVASRNVQQAAGEIQDVLTERDPSSIGVVALSTTGGVIGAQEVADRVLPALGMSREPTTATEFAASGGVKTGTAAVIGVLATRFSGLPLVATSFAGVGALASAGADFVNAVQRTGFFAEAPFQGRQTAQSSGGQAEPASSGAAQASSAEVRV